MKKNTTTLTIIGFLLFIAGFSSIVLMLVGLNLSYLQWLDAGGKLLGFVLRMLMIMAGFTLVYLAQSDFRGED